MLGDEVHVQVKRGILHPDALEKLRGGAGYKNTQHDLQLLVNIFRNNWPALTGKTLTTEAELARGEKLLLLNPRHTMTVLRGPLTRGELERAQAERMG